MICFLHCPAGRRLPGPARRPVPPLRHGLRRRGRWLSVMDKRLLPHRGRSRRRCVRSESAAMAGLRPGHGGSAHAPPRQTFREHSPGSPVRRPLRGRSKGGVSGNSGVISYLAGEPGPAADHQPKAERRDGPNGHGARGRARQEAPPGTDGPAARVIRRPVVAGGAESPAERPWTSGLSRLTGRPGGRSRLLFVRPSRAASPRPPR